MPKAVLNGTVIAEADASEVLHIEGSVYFPPSSVKSEFLEKSPTPYTCAWKGDCQYFSVKDGDQLLQRAIPHVLYNVLSIFTRLNLFWMHC